jgi:hypothetical protein
MKVHNGTTQICLDDVANRARTVDILFQTVTTIFESDFDRFVFSSRQVRGAGAVSGGSGGFCRKFAREHCVPRLQAYVSFERSAQQRATDDQEGRR